MTIQWASRSLGLLPTGRLALETATPWERQCLRGVVLSWVWNSTNRAQVALRPPGPSNLLRQQRASRRKRAKRSGSSAKAAGSSLLATSRLRVVSCAFQTTPMPPSPSFSIRPVVQQVLAGLDGHRDPRLAWDDSRGIGASKLGAYGGCNGAALSQPNAVCDTTIVACVYRLPTHTEVPSTG